jgi:thiamine biosynthesis lipoprotein ApbE
MTGHRQATVVARDAATSDMLATTLCVLGSAEGVALVDDTAGAAAMFGETDGTGRVQWTYSRGWAHGR